MCDPFSASQGILSLAQGNVQAREAKSRGEFEKAQADAIGVMAQARGSRNERDLRRNMSQLWQQNIAAMAASGLDPSSFNSISDASQNDLILAMADNHANVRSEKNAAIAQGNAAALQAQFDAAAARYSGMIGALNAFGEGFKNYQRYKTDKTSMVGNFIGQERAANIKGRMSSTGYSFFFKGQ